jgi:dTDP-D-glucose 4,6-dehydratase
MEPDYMISQDERVLVTGCSGFVGTKVLRDNIFPRPATRLTLICNLLVSGSGSPPGELKNFSVVP